MNICFIPFLLYTSSAFHILLQHNCLTVLNYYQCFLSRPTLMLNSFLPISNTTLSSFMVVDSFGFWEKLWCVLHWKGEIRFNNSLLDLVATATCWFNTDSALSLIGMDRKSTETGFAWYSVKLNIYFDLNGQLCNKLPMFRTNWRNDQLNMFARTSHRTLTLKSKLRIFVELV